MDLLTEIPDKTITITQQATDTVISVPKRGEFTCLSILFHGSDLINENVALMVCSPAVMYVSFSIRFSDDHSQVHFGLHVPRDLLVEYALKLSQR